jgi:hypothetical protein
LFSVVETDQIVNKLLENTQKVVGDLSQPNTGILIVLPVAHVFGLKSYYPV